MVELIVRSGKQDGKKIIVRDDEEIVFGRDETCKIRLGSSDVSRRHAALKATPEGVFVRDLGSRNGTFVNDQLIAAEVEMSPGDMLRIGPILLELGGAPGDKKTKAARRPSNVPTISRPDLSLASDDDIAGWLSDTEIPEYKGGDTTIISAPIEEPTTTINPPPPNLPKRKFNTVAEEAADIIRRHHEMMKQDEADEKQLQK